jgi:hypothetical protein
VPTFQECNVFLGQQSIRRCVDCNLTVVFVLLLLRCHYQGWEETVNASVTFLLKTTLAKTAKEGSSSLSGTTLEVKGRVFWHCWRR